MSYYTWYDNTHNITIYNNKTYTSVRHSAPVSYTHLDVYKRQHTYSATAYWITKLSETVLSSALFLSRRAQSNDYYEFNFVLNRN